MSKIVITGGKTLKGEIKISGAKNSAVALIPAAILSCGTTKIYNTPNISDTKNLISIIEYLGGKCNFENDILTIDGENITNKAITNDLSIKLRASYYFMGALLARFKKVEMFFPGGCKIGTRPIDIHLKGFEKLGATITVCKDKYTLNAEKLVGCDLYLDFASVGATINLMMAAVYAEGNTTINNAAKEPEIVNVASLLNNMGAKITGAGTSEIKIVGVKSLGNAVIDVIPDRIEAGTYVIAGALMGNSLKIIEIIPEHLEALLSKLKEIGVVYTIGDNYVEIKSGQNYQPVNIKTLPYPGFPTDLGQPIAALLTRCNGASLFDETIYENRIGHIKYLNKMGANIVNKKSLLTIKGPSKLIGKNVVSTDLRAGASLIIAALSAKGTTTINDIEHILRGYEDIVEKLKKVGAEIKIV